jgi:hypothetical protein
MLEVGANLGHTIKVLGVLALIGWGAWLFYKGTR